MDPWPQLIFQMADGEHTVAELIDDLASGYKDGPPDGLADQVYEIIRDLEAEGLIRIYSDPTPLSPEFAQPVPQNENRN